MKLTLSQIRNFIIVLCLVIVSFSSGWWTHERGLGFGRFGITTNAIERTVPSDKNADFSLFWEVWDRLGASYFDKSKLNENKMVLGAIQGMVAAVGDPYTVFLPPDDQKRTQEDLGGEFEGVGIQIGFKGSQLAVIAPLDDTPAEKAGIKSGDFIVGIKDKNKDSNLGTVGISLPGAVEAIRGKAGTPVTLVLTREGVGQPFEVEVVRAKIEVPSVKLTFVGDNNSVAYLQLFKFGDNTNGEWDRAISEIQNKKPKGVILDLRNNPGGYLNGAVSISSEFIPQGVAVMQEDSKGVRKEFRVTGRARLASIPLVVLVNGGSASASEIVAGALKDHDRAKVVGEKSFGKGTIQESLQLGNSGLHVTTAKWLTPKGIWVNENGGLEPNIEVKDNPDTDNDEQVETAISQLQ